MQQGKILLLANLQCCLLTAWMSFSKAARNSALDNRLQHTQKALFNTKTLKTSPT